MYMYCTHLIIWFTVDFSINIVKCLANQLISCKNQKNVKKQKGTIESFVFPWLYCGKESKVAIRKTKVWLLLGAIRFFIDFEIVSH